MEDFTEDLVLSLSVAPPEFEGDSSESDHIPRGEVVHIHREESHFPCALHHFFLRASEEGEESFYKLLDSRGYPTCLLVKLMRDVVSEVAQLHDSGIAHGNLKPQNVMICHNKYSLFAAISDETIIGCQIADDLFEIGCFLLFCTSGGMYPFGEDGGVNLNVGDYVKPPEAEDIIRQLVDAFPDKRPSARQVLSHPLFWDDPMKRLDFLIRSSIILDRVEGRTRDALFKSLKSVALTALGATYVSESDGEMNSRYDLGALGRYLRDIRRTYDKYLNQGITCGLYNARLNKDIRFLEVRERLLHPRLLIEVHNVMVKHATQIAASRVDPTFVGTFFGDFLCIEEENKMLPLLCVLAVSIAEIFMLARAVRLARRN